MALDPNDCIEEPYGFGECYEDNCFALVKCNAWKEPQQFIVIPVRKRGKVTQILFPELIYYSNKEGGQDIITIAFEDEDEIDRYLGKNPQSMRSTAVGMSNGEICSVQIDMDLKGNFYIAPVEDNEGFKPDGNQVGMFATTFTFLPNDDVEREVNIEDEDVNFAIAI